ncbi:DUF2905 domain-containing protein [Bacteroidota bacterium]
MPGESQSNIIVNSSFNYIGNNKMSQIVGKYLIIFGLILLVVGIITYFGGGYLGWFGKLPGDIRVQKENFRFYFPITSMILVSIIITVIINLIRKFFN